MERTTTHNPNNPNNTANIMKNFIPQTAPTPTPTPTPAPAPAPARARARALAHCPTWFVVFLYLTSFGMAFYILFKIYTSLEIL